MSNKLQDTKQTRSLLIIIGAIIVGITGWYVMQSKDNANKSLDSAENVQATADDAQKDTYKGWKDYSWSNMGVSFKYPGDWIVKEDAKMDRLYVRNSDVDLLKEETPADFQQLWVSTDVDEASAEREAAIKKGSSAYRIVDGDVKASTVKAGDVTINVYEYNTTGGATAEAYWTGKNGTRYYATNSTEVGEQNQKDMVANLKKLLASVTLK
jgi:hypothetical protein